MLRDLKLNVFYPYSPQRVWQAITNRHALAQWLMENDFEPRVGHKFRFEPQPHQGFHEAIHCEVIELDEPRRLSYTWRGGLSGKLTIVTWRLVPVEGGTQLQMEHTGFERNASTLSQPMHLAQTWLGNSSPQAVLKTYKLEPITPSQSFSAGFARVENCDTVTLNFYLDGGWHAAINTHLQNLLGTRLSQSIAQC